MLADGVLPETRTKVLNSLPLGSVSIQWVTVDSSLFREFETAEHVSKMTYVRLLIPQVFPSTVTRVLYLDTDLLVLADLGPLWATELHGAVVGAATDRWDLRIRRREPGLENVPLVRSYFNAGVLLIDLSNWRRERISEKAMGYMAQHPQTPFMDQDALNVACDGLWHPLESRWNVHSHFDLNVLGLAPEQRPAIIHFVGKAKPWYARIPNVNARLYDGFRSRTCFARTPSEEVLDVFRGLPGRPLQFWWGLRRRLSKHAFARALWRLVKRPKSIRV